MAHKQHDYQVRLVWTGNTGNGTASYRGYSRAHEIHAHGKAVIQGSSDPAFRGDSTCWNPEELLVASLAACHKLWFLGLCAEAGVCVVAYEDNAQGAMAEQGDGAGQFTSVVLRPRVVLAAGSDIEKAKALHTVAHEKCFIARSVNFPVSHQVEVLLADC